jgi:thiol-disulfide isomerase/thioredoxin
MQKKLFTIVLAALCLNFKTQAQNNQTSLKSLSIGDTIPKSIWKMPMQVVNQSDHQQKITLNNYRGKVIILDFWATWCSSCIKHFLKADSLEKEFDQDLQIILVNSITGTGDTESKVYSFYAKWNNNHIHPLVMPSIFGDTVLKQLFPHSFIPHYVWIGSDGKVKAITSSEEVTSQNIQLLINHTELHLPIKKH